MLILPSDEFCTTKCCSRCGGETRQPGVEWDEGEQHLVRLSNRWRECGGECRRDAVRVLERLKREELESVNRERREGQAGGSGEGVHGQPGGGGEGEQGEGHEESGGEGDGGVIKSGRKGREWRQQQREERRRVEREERVRQGLDARCPGVRQTRRGFRLHRDLNAAWNLWEVAVAQYGGLPRPAWLSRQDPAA